MKKKTLTLLLAAAVFAGGLGAASADSILTKLIPAAAGGYLVTAIARPLNGFINGLMDGKGVGNRDATKVVPILTLGSGTYIGAAQVVGSQSAVNHTQAVVSFRGSFAGDAWNASALVPVSSLNVSGSGSSRVYDVGVDAVINARL